MDKIRYRLMVTRVEPDPNFASKMEEFEKEHRFARGWDRDMMPHKPNENKTTEVLIVELSELQFNKVKSEVVKTFQ